MRRVVKAEGTENENKERIRRLSEELNGEIKPPPKPILFESANAAKEVPVSPGLTEIVETVFLDSEEIAGFYKQCEGALEPLGDHLEYGHLMRALDVVDQLGFKARRLYATARLEKDIWERKNEVNLAAIRHEAHKALQAEKEDGRRNKTITDKDVEAQCALIAPDQWEAQELKRSKLKHTEGVLEGLVEQIASRARSLQTMLGKSSR